MTEMGTGKDPAVQEILIDLMARTLLLSLSRYPDRV